MTSAASPSAVDAYLDRLRDLLERMRTTQRAALLDAARRVADSLSRDGVIHLFGTGHSHLLAEEIFYRAGGVIPVDAMLDTSVVLSGGALRSTQTERRSGAAAEIAARYDLRAIDVGVVISNSGRNPAPVEMARIMRQIGMPVIAVTSVAHATALPPLDPPGARLLEVCDVVLDTGAGFGDACITLAGVPYPTGPTSTVIGAAILQTLVIAAMEELLRRGLGVVNLPSANVPQPDMAAVLAEVEKYRGRIRHL
jgi:uncharacterized phosphosugar-binding protein